MVLDNLSPFKWLRYIWYQISARLSKYFGTYIWLLWNIRSTPSRSCFWCSYFVWSTLSLEFLWFSYFCCSLCISGSTNRKLTLSSLSLLNANSSFAWSESFIVIHSYRLMVAKGRWLRVCATIFSIMYICLMLGPDSLSMSFHRMTLWDALIVAL